MTALMWRLYIYRAGAEMAPAIAASPHRHRLNLLTSVAHLVMVAGVILTAAGFTLATAHPTKQPPPTPWVVGTLGGAAVFLAGRSAFEYLIFGRVSRRRLVAILVLIAALPAALHLPPHIYTAATTLVLAAIAVLDAVSRPPEPAPPT
jgi:low temperature requirement protein LtrA